MLDPNFAKNRILYFTYFAPPSGEAAKPAGRSRISTRTSGRSRSPNAGPGPRHRARGRAKLSADNSRSPTSTCSLEGVERNIVLAPDGTMFVIGADAFRFYDSDLDGIEAASSPTIPTSAATSRAASFASTATARSRKTTRGSAARPCRARPSHTASRIPKARRSIPRPASCGPSITARRAATRSTSSAPATTTGGPMCRTARSTTRGKPTGRRTCPSAAGKLGSQASRSRSTSGCRRSRRPA